MDRYTEIFKFGERTMVTLSRSYHGELTPGVMADQRKGLAGTTELTDTVILFTLPGFELSTFESASRDTVFLN